MKHLRLFVKIQSDTMTAIISYDRETVFVSVFSYHMGNVTDKTIRHGSLSTFVQTFLRHTYKFFFLWCSLTYNKHTACIAVVTFINSRDINIDNIAVLKDNIIAWYTVAYLLIYTCTHAFGETLIVQRRRYGIMVCCKGIYPFVYICCRHTSLDVFRYIIQHSGIDFPTLSYTCNLGSPFYQLPCRHKVTFFLKSQDTPVLFRHFLTFRHYPVSTIFLRHDIPYYSACKVKHFSPKSLSVFRKSSNFAIR